MNVRKLAARRIADDRRGSRLRRCRARNCRSTPGRGEGVHTSIRSTIAAARDRGSVSRERSSSSHASRTFHRTAAGRFRASRRNEAARRDGEWYRRRPGSRHFPRSGPKRAQYESTVDGVDDVPPCARIAGQRLREAAQGESRGSRQRTRSALRMLPPRRRSCRRLRRAWGNAARAVITARGTSRAIRSRTRRLKDPEKASHQFIGL
jgi:hypothetical protein